MGNPDFDEGIKRGLAAEEAWARTLAARGHHAIRMFPDAASLKGPRIYTGAGDVVSPDILAITHAGSVIWFEVKAKTYPGYRYCGDKKGWEHGVNWNHFLDYGKCAERARVHFVVKEEYSPRSLELLGEPPIVNGKPDYMDYKRHCVQRETWRWIAYQDALAHGRKQEAWSQATARDGTRYRVAGWLWPLARMTVFDVARMTVFDGQNEAMEAARWTR